MTPPAPPRRDPAWLRYLGSERVGRRTVAVVLSAAAVLAVLGIVNQFTGREDRAGAAHPSATPTATATPTPSRTLAPEAGPETTGVPDGVELNPLEPGPVEDDDLVLDGVHVAGDLELTGVGQVLRNSRVDGHVLVRGEDVTIEDSEVGALSVASATGVVVRRVEVFGLLGYDGIHVTSDGEVRTSDVLIEGCWVHSPQVAPGSHYDAVQVRGVDGLTIRRSTLDLGDWVPQHNAAVFLEDANGGNTDVLVEENLLNGGGYTMYLMGTGVRVVDNRFGPDLNWALLYPEFLPFEESGNSWADGGSPVELTDPAS